MSMIIDGTNGLTFNNATTQASAGNVLQVVNATLNSLVSTTSTTYVSTTLAASITPKFSTSKILILVAGVGSASVAATSRYTIFKNSTNLASTNFSSITSNSDTPLTISFLDSPATTSSTTYTVYYAASSSGTAYFNDSGYTSTITLMEIAG